MSKNAKKKHYYHGRRSGHRNYQERQRQINQQVDRAMQEITPHDDSNHQSVGEIIDAMSSESSQTRCSMDPAEMTSTTETHEVAHDWLEDEQAPGEGETPTDDVSANEPDDFPDEDAGQGEDGYIEDEYDEDGCLICPDPTGECDGNEEDEAQEYFAMNDAQEKAEYDDSDSEDPDDEYLRRGLGLVAMIAACLVIMLIAAFFCLYSHLELKDAKAKVQALEQQLENSVKFETNINFLNGSNPELFDSQLISIIDPDGVEHLMYCYKTYINTTPRPDSETWLNLTADNYVPSYNEAGEATFYKIAKKFKANENDTLEMESLQYLRVGREVFCIKRCFWEIDTEDGIDEVIDEINQGKHHSVNITDLQFPLGLDQDRINSLDFNDEAILNSPWQTPNQCCSCESCCCDPGNCHCQ